MSAKDAIQFHNSQFTKINNLLKPLLNFFVRNIIYIELIPGKNKAFFLSNTYGIIENFLKIGGFSDNFYSTLEQTNPDDFCRSFIWPANSTDPVAAMLKKMNLTEGFTVIQRSPHLVKTWAFANNSNDHMLINLFVNKPNIFHHFIKYFNIQINKHLYPIKDIYFTEFKTFKNHLLTNHESELKNKISSFKQNIPIKRHYISNTSDIYITDQELHCLFQLSTGKTHKEIGKTLDISPKTVRCHIDAVKLKTNITCKHILINTLRQKNLFDHL